MFQNDIEIIDGDRFDMSLEQLTDMMGWMFGVDGVVCAELWAAFNQRFWDGRLRPCPMFFPTATSYGRWIGLYTANRKRQTLHIQLKRNLTTQGKAGVLLHEMVHQYLCESQQRTEHNAIPWCSEIMRITQELWGVRIHASPASPRKVNGRSVRKQKPADDGQASIKRRDIAGWPHSLGLLVPIEEFTTAN